MNRTQIESALARYVEASDFFGETFLPHEERRLRERVFELHRRRAAHARRPSRRTRRRVEHARSLVHEAMLPPRDRYWRKAGKRFVEVLKDESTVLSHAEIVPMREDP